MGLLAVATLIVDIIAVRLMPGRQTYKKFKYEETPYNESEYLPSFLHSFQSDLKRLLILQILGTRQLAGTKKLVKPMLSTLL